MSAKDKFHDVVKAALQKDGWQITHDPLVLRVQGIADLYVDLGAENSIAADRQGEKIAVEIKALLAHLQFLSFTPRSGGLSIIDML
jgi:XisH protein